FGADPKNQVLFITQPGKPQIPGVTQVVYKPKRDPTPDTHFYIRNLESGVLLGQAVARVSMELRNKGFVPDVICAHPSWGESLYVKDVYPAVPLLGFCEFYYRAVGADVGFDPPRQVTLEDRCRVRTRNSIHLLGLEACDAGIAPTQWQRSQFPREFLHKIVAIHDGIDTDVARPKPDAEFRLPDGRVLTRCDEVVTYVARNLEPYRGFPTLMRVVAESCRRRPSCHYIIIGGDGVSYGRPLPNDQTYRAKMLSEVAIDESRVHFLGKVPYDDFLTVLRVSSAHVYLTYPFVLSWSMLEAMAAGCLVIGSDTAPVTEVIQDGRNGLLADFFSHDGIADRVDEVFAHKDQMAVIRRRARDTVVERYDLQQCLRRQVRLIDDLIAGRHRTNGQPKVPQAQARNPVKRPRPRRH
ncbi:MAG: glycosyltransferase family 4 protein, partial [Dongiaceae bacterium]